MSGPTNGAAAKDALDLPAFSLDVEALDLGAGVKAVSLEILETESREPVRGKQATEFWAAVFPLLAGNEPYVLDFFSHLDRLRDYLEHHQIPFRLATKHTIVVPAPELAVLEPLLDRFQGETFGARAGGPLAEGDPALEGELARRGVDAYHSAFAKYFFCAICNFEDGSLVLLSEKLWASEVIRRVRPGLQPFDVHIARPN